VYNAAKRGDFSTRQNDIRRRAGEVGRTDRGEQIFEAVPDRRPDDPRSTA